MCVICVQCMLCTSELVLLKFLTESKSCWEHGSFVAITDGKKCRISEAELSVVKWCSDAFQQMSPAKIQRLLMGMDVTTSTLHVWTVGRFIGCQSCAGLESRETNTQLSCQGSKSNCLCITDLHYLFREKMALCPRARARSLLWNLHKYAGDEVL